MSSTNYATYLQNRLDVTTRCSDIKTKVILKRQQIVEAISHIDLLTNKIKRVRVTLQNNDIFQNHLEMELSTLEYVRSTYHRFIAYRRRDLVELKSQTNDLFNEMAMITERMLTERMEDDDSDSDESDCDKFDCDESESGEFESDEFESDEFESDEFESDGFESDKLESDELESDELESDELESDEL